MPFLRDRLLKTQACDVVLLVGVALCMVLGGGDAAAPWMDSVVEACIAMVVTTWFWIVPASRFAAIPVAAWVVAGLIVVLPLLQLVPLPPSWWHALPGREVERQALALVGQGESWRPLTMTPGYTVNAALFALCVAVFVPMTAAADRGGRTRLMAVVIVVAVISIMVGSQQMMGGANNSFSLYYEGSASAGLAHLQGFQWNRNSQADVLLLAMLADAGCAAELLCLPYMERNRRMVILLAVGLALLLALGVVLTGSRTGVLLIVPVELAQLFILSPHIRLRLSAGLLLLPVIGALVLAALWDNPVLVGALSHFKDTREFRPEVWANTQLLMEHHAVWGVGLGGFAPAFAVVERLEILNPAYVARPYEDYAQLVVEAGVPGVLLLLAVTGVMMVHAIRGWRRPAEFSRAHYGFALSALIMLAAHALWDYPLHSTSLACLAACCCAMLLPRRTAGALR